LSRSFAALTLRCIAAPARKLLSLLCVLLNFSKGVILIGLERNTVSC
jgi:hypothetical protein